MIQEFYNKLSAQEKKIFYAAFFLGVLAFFDVLFLRPVTNRLKNLDKDIQEKTNSLRRDIRFLSYRDRIIKEEKEFRTYQTDENKPEDEIIAGFLKTIELIATESSITLVKLNPGEVVHKKGYIQYHANLECEGALADMVQFIHKIDSTKNLLKVVKVSMTGNKARVEDVSTSFKVAKLVIDPKTVGNYEYAGEDENVPEDVLSPGQGKDFEQPEKSFSPETPMNQTIATTEKMVVTPADEASTTAPQEPSQGDGPANPPEDKSPGEKDKKGNLIKKSSKKEWQIGNIVDLWYKFIGKKPEEIKRRPTKPEKDPSYLEDWSNRKNIWERVLDKK